MIKFATQPWYIFKVGCEAKLSWTLKLINLLFDCENNSLGKYYLISLYIAYYSQKNEVFYRLMLEL